MQDGMQHIGKVVAIDGDIAIVRFVRSKACAHCGACISFGDTEAETKLKNEQCAQVGDWVRVELESRGFIMASLIAYGLPLAALLLGVFVGSFIGQAAAALFGLGFAAGTYFIFRMLEPKFSRMRQLKPRMISIEAEFEPEVHNKEE